MTFCALTHGTLDWTSAMVAGASARSRAFKALVPPPAPTPFALQRNCIAL